MSAFEPGVAQFGHGHSPNGCAHTIRSLTEISIGTIPRGYATDYAMDRAIIPPVRVVMSASLFVYPIIEVLNMEAKYV